VIPTGVPENELHNAKMRIDLSRHTRTTLERLQQQHY
jgi:hypothetical protein